MTSSQTTTRSQLYWGTLLRLPTQALAFVLSLAVARILMPSDYGILGAAMMLIGFANLFTDFGFSTAIVQKQIEDEDTLQSVFTFNLVFSTLLAVAFSLSSGLIARFFRSPECRNVVIVMSSVFVITSFSAVPRAILRRDANFKTLSLVDAASALTMGIVTLCLAFAHLGYWALVWGQLIPMVTFTIYVCVLVRWKLTIRYRRHSMSGVFEFGIWNILKTQLEFALGQVDKLLLGRYAGVVPLGFYDKARTTAGVLSDSFIANVHAVLFSSFSQRQGDKDDVRDLLKKGLMTVSLISFPIHIGLCLVARHFIVGLMGKKWAPMIVPLQIIAASYSVKSIGGLLVSVNVALGKYRAHTLRYLFAGCVFVTACLLSLPYGTVGISVAFFVFVVTYGFLALQLTVKASGLRWHEVLRAFRPASVATGIMAAATWLLSLLLSAPTILNLFVLCSVGAITYALCLAVERDFGFMALRRAALSDWSRLVRSNQNGA